MRHPVRLHYTKKLSRMLVEMNFMCYTVWWCLFKWLVFTTQPILGEKSKISSEVLNRFHWNFTGGKHVHLCLSQCGGGVAGNSKQQLFLHRDISVERLEFPACEKYVLFWLSHSHSISVYVINSNKPKFLWISWISGCCQLFPVCTQWLAAFTFVIALTYDYDYI